MTNSSNTIVTKGRGVRMERLAASAFNPGHLIELTSSDTFQKHSVAGGPAAPLVAVEYDITGNGIDTAYATGDRVFGQMLNAGDEFYGYVGAAALAITLGDRLESAGNGTLRKQVNDALFDIGTLAISGVAAEKFKTTTTAAYKIGGAQYTKAATDNLTFTAAHVVTATLWGIILIQINAAGTVSTKVPAATQAYASQALALAALPQADANNVALGYIIINADSGDWTANTDDMTNGSDLTTATFTDATPLTVEGDHAIVQALESVDNSGGSSEAAIKVLVL